METIYIEKIARLAHEANKVWCEMHGDNSQAPWEETPQHIKDSAMNGVAFSIVDPETTPEDSHKNWFEYKKNDGWVYGEEKCLVKKTHPCMVPYSFLPEMQRKKDMIFTTIVKLFAKCF